MQRHFVMFKEGLQFLSQHNSFRIVEDKIDHIFEGSVREKSVLWELSPCLDQLQKAQSIQCTGLQALKLELLRSEDRASGPTLLLKSMTLMIQTSWEMLLGTQESFLLPCCVCIECFLMWLAHAVFLKNNFYLLCQDFTSHRWRLTYDRLMTCAPSLEGTTYCSVSSPRAV